VVILCQAESWLFLEFIRIEYAAATGAILLSAGSFPAVVITVSRSKTNGILLKYKIMILISILYRINEVTAMSESRNSVHNVGIHKN
jgi:hypothetical protein